LALFAEIANYKYYDKDEVVLRQGNTKPQSLFLIASGQVKVFVSGIDGAETVLAILNEGEFFGEMLLIDGESRSASVKTVQKSELLVIRRDDFLNELKKNPRLAMTLLIEMSRRIRSINQKLVNLESMSALIREFKKEHSEILAVLNEVEGFDILSKEGQAKLMSVKMILLEHLKKEDVKFYPVLYKVAEHNNNLKNILDLFVMDVENVSRVALEFFDKYYRGVLGKKSQEEFESLFVTLRNRIRNEEDLLYKEYEKINESLNQSLVIC
jgi:CRP-like cAMP-binding protein